MLVENQLVEVKWNNYTKRWYEDKGYVFTHVGDTFIVKGEDVHPNSSVYVNVKCDHCGKVFSQQYYYYTKTQKKNGTECVQCKGKCNAERSLKKRQEKFYQKALNVCEERGYKIISKPSDYVNSSSIITYYCCKHGIKQCRWSNFIRGFCCNECGNEIISNKNRLSTGQLLENVNKKNASVLLNPEDYIDNSTSNLCFRCTKCGNLFYTSLVSFNMNSGFCQQCGLNSQIKNRQKPINEVIDIIESKNQNTLLNPQDYKNSNTNNLQIKCGSCGKIFMQSLSNYQKSNLTGKCPDCNETSYGEFLVATYLEKYNVKYKRWHKYDDCKDKRYLPFDFYLPDYNMVIEFDGIQHYEPIWGEDAFKMTKLHDAMKNQYCRWNNINLLRIPYWERENIENILVDTFNLASSNSKQNCSKIKYISNKKLA